MSKFVVPAARGGISRLMSGIGPQIMFAPDADGNATPEETAAAEAAAAAEKAAADKAAADKAAADKAEADRLAAEEAEREKNMTDAEKEKAKLLREVMEKKNKLKEEQAEKERLTAELKKFEGLDLDKVKKLLEDEKTREEKELEAKGEYDRLRERIAAEREAEKKAFEEQIEALKTKNQELAGNIDKLTIGSSFSNSTFIKDDMVYTPTKARQIYGSHFELKDGEIVAYDKPAGDAGRTMYVDAAGQPLSFDAAMKKIVEADPEKETILRVKAKPGGHSNNQQVRQPEVSGDENLHGATRIAAALAKRQQK